MSADCVSEVIPGMTRVTFYMKHRNITSFEKKHVARNTQFVNKLFRTDGPKGVGSVSRRHVVVPNLDIPHPPKKNGLD